MELPLGGDENVVELAGVKWSVSNCFHSADRGKLLTEVMTVRTLGTVQGCFPSPTYSVASIPQAPSRYYT